MPRFFYGLDSFYCLICVLLLATYWTLVFRIIVLWLVCGLKDRLVLYICCHSLMGRLFVFKCYYANNIFCCCWGEGYQPVVGRGSLFFWF